MTQPPIQSVADFIYNRNLKTKYINFPLIVGHTYYETL